MRLALYKGPADGWVRKIGHWVVCVFTRSKYSHVELVIDDICYTSSAREGGVRSKAIDLASGKWDVYDIRGDQVSARAWFTAHMGEKYDWCGVFRFAFPFLPRRNGDWFCSEAVAAALGLANPDAYAPQSLLDALT